MRVFHQSFLRPATTLATCSVFLSPFQIAQTRHTLLRNYATASNDKEDLDKNLLSWPTINDPSPYDIFRLKHASPVDKTHLKRMFHQFAQVYHPDSTKGHVEGGLSHEEREERFKKIVTAYHILKNDAKRKDFDLFNKGWDGVPRTQSFYNRDWSKATKIRTDFGGENAAWSDYHSDYRQHMKQQNAEYQQEQWEKHKKMVLALLVGSFMIGGIQFFFLMRQAVDDSEKRNTGSKKSAQDVYLATTNYGFGFQKEDRIARFLAQRDDSLYDETADKESHLQGMSPYSLTSMVPQGTRDAISKFGDHEHVNKEVDKVGAPLLEEQVLLLPAPSEIPTR